MKKKYTVVLIPVRGGSKSIPLKNVKEFCGKPLVYWTINAAANCCKVDKVYVSTDSEHIRAVVSQFGFNKVEVIGRSEDSASDTASTEAAMLEFAAKYEFDDIILVQATSPLLTSDDIAKGIELYNESGVDSVLSVVRQKRFNWNYDASGYGIAQNYDFYNRPRRQDFNGYLVENGAFYITSKELLLRSKCRISGRIKCAEMPEDTYFEIDEPSDWEIMEGLMKKRLLFNTPTIPKIKMFLTDSDGCLTDGGMYYSEKGDELKKFNTRDGMGFKMLRERGIICGIVTGENSELVRCRAKKLNLDVCMTGVDNKLACVKNLCDEYKISMDEVAYIGDDINDVEVIKSVGFGCCVNDACQGVREVSKYITKNKGGEGAIRELIEVLL